MSRPARASAAALVAGALVLLVCAGCRNGMADQPRIDPMQAMPPGAENVSPGPAEGTLPREEVDPGPPATYTLALLQRGRERFDAFCSPCHGRDGHGKGVVVRRGFLGPPTYHQDRLRNAPDEHFFGVISNGAGRMYSYQRIPVPDRWAIVAYIRALQLSQDADVSQLPPEVRVRLGGGSP